MKFFTHALVAMALGLSLATSYAIAQDAQPTATPTETMNTVVEPVTPPEASDGTFVDSTADAIKQIGTVTKAEGATRVSITLAIIMIISQLLIQFTKTSIFGKLFRKMHAKGKLAIVSVLTVLTTLVPLLQNGVSFLAALLTGGVLTALMVAGHQVYDAFFKQEKPATPAA